MDVLIKLTQLLEAGVKFSWKHKFLLFVSPYIPRVHFFCRVDGVERISTAIRCFKLDLRFRVAFQNAVFNRIASCDNEVKRKNIRILASLNNN